MEKDILSGEKKSNKFIPDPYPILLFSRRGPQNVLHIFKNVLKIVIFVFLARGICPPGPHQQGFAPACDPTGAQATPGPRPGPEGFFAEEFPGLVKDPTTAAKKKVLSW